ncbi:MAG: TIR domain-containing protein [Chlorobium sp.]
MADIFISYAREDLVRVIPIAKELEKVGWSVFWDKKTPPGKQWRIYLKERLDESCCVLVVWSPDSIKSHWVHAEADEALNRNILIPLLLDEVTPPFGLGHIQAADLSNWQQNRDDPEFRQLIAAITDIIPLPQKSTPKPALSTVVPAPGQKPAATALQGSPVRQQSAASMLNIGDEYGGGKIAWLDASGQHGLIAAKADLPGRDITWEAAKKACRELVNNGYSDWYLPTKEELNKLYYAKSAVGGFSDDFYWSSTEDSAGGAWIQDFDSGYQGNDGKSFGGCVRAVRAF